MRDYEIVYIFRSSLTSEEIEAKLERYHAAITADGPGEITASVHWGKRQLAYPIKRQPNGYYVVAQFTSAPEPLRELERVLKLEDDILRYLIVIAEYPLPLPDPVPETPAAEEAEAEAADAEEPAAEEADAGEAEAGTPDAEAASETEEAEETDEAEESDGAEEADDEAEEADDEAEESDDEAEEAADEADEAADDADAETEQDSEDADADADAGEPEEPADAKEE